MTGRRVRINDVRYDNMASSMHRHRHNDSVLTCNCRFFQHRNYVHICRLSEIPSIRNIAIIVSKLESVS